jgi:preprotein translocase subunit YajC
VTLGYFYTSGIFGLGFGIFIFMIKRRQWHKTSAFEEVSAP